MRIVRYKLTIFAKQNCVPKGTAFCKLRAEATKKWRLVEG